MKKLILIGLVLMLGCARSGQKEETTYKVREIAGNPSITLHDGVLVTIQKDDDGRVIRIIAYKSGTRNMYK